MKKMDGKHGPLGHQGRRNHDPSTNRSNVAERFEKKSRRNDKNAHKLQQSNTKDTVNNTSNHMNKNGHWNIPSKAKYEKIRNISQHIAIKIEENDIEIRIIRAKNDIEEEEIANRRAHSCELSPQQEDAP